MSKNWWASTQMWLGILLAVFGGLQAAQSYINTVGPNPWTAATWIGLALVLLGVVIAALRTLPQAPIKGTAGERAAQAQQTAVMEATVSALAPRVLGQSGGVQFTGATQVQGGVAGHDHTTDGPR